MTKRDLSQQRCKPCEGGIPALTPSEIMPFMTALTEWQCAENSLSLHRRIEFKGFYKTMSFINAVAWIAQQEQHHPDIKFGYNYCEITYTTHAIGGLSKNDFICAAKVDQLLLE